MEIVTNTDINDVLSVVAKNQNWTNFDVRTNYENDKGNGFSGEFIMASIENKDTGEKLNLAIKKAFTNKLKREKMPMRQCYLNEINFYSNVVPTTSNFLNEKGQSEMLNMIGKHYLSISEEFNEMIVMDNLKEQGYDILGREALLDDELMKLIFKTYGKFHAVSFALKIQQPLEYTKLLGGIIDPLLNITNVSTFLSLLTDVSLDCFNFLDDKLKIDCKNLFENAGAVFKNIINYEGKYSCIVHGDCWSNNMMFKYENKILKGIKLIDFQLIREGTPVYDLAYFFYAGGSKALYKNLDKYLQLYYDSFSQTASLLGSEAANLMSLDDLKEDWRKYYKFGFFMALIVMKLKLTSSEDVQLMANNDNENFMERFENAKINKNVYQQRIQDIAEHLCENKFV